METISNEKKTNIQTNKKGRSKIKIKTNNSLTYPLGIIAKFYF